LDDTVIPYFYEKSEFKLVSRFLRIFGIGESAMEDKIIDLIDAQTNPTIAPYAKDGEVTLRVTARYGKDETEADIISPVVEEIKKRLGDTVYSTENKNMEEVAAQLLVNTNTTIAIAESCTGGLVSTKLTDIPGVSKVFDRGIISYSNLSKVESLGVKKETIEKYGAVSRETAIEMANGVKYVSHTDMGLSITGIAGPDGGTEEKPVGLVYVALSTDKGVQCTELKLWGGRNRIRNVTSLHAFDMVRRYLTGLKKDRTGG
ncbi:MAG: nicotinamide-nucleotide amidohydrolase family protein, partial [Ruminiclostridium sp.]|nr:nicotinamide-nucleotide amidohydrolase family protein [Ruminiclostridium sp.]